jgi:hypothetical protein
MGKVTPEKGRIEIKLRKGKGKELFFPFVFDVSCANNKNNDNKLIL